MKTKIVLDIPDSVIKHAMSNGISIDSFKKFMEIFGTMRLASEASKLDMEKANAISEKIKAAYTF